MYSWEREREEWQLNDPKSLLLGTCIWHSSQQLLNFTPDKTRGSGCSHSNPDLHSRRGLLGGHLDPGCFSLGSVYTKGLLTAWICCALGPPSSPPCPTPSLPALLLPAAPRWSPAASPPSPLWLSGSQWPLPPPTHPHSHSNGQLTCFLALKLHPPGLWLNSHLFTGQFMTRASPVWEEVMCILPSEHTPFAPQLMTDLCGSFLLAPGWPGAFYLGELES